MTGAAAGYWTVTEFRSWFGTLARGFALTAPIDASRVLEVAEGQIGAPPAEDTRHGSFVSLADRAALLAALNAGLELVSPAGTLRAGSPELEALLAGPRGGLEHRCAVYRALRPGEPVPPAPSDPLAEALEVAAFRDEAWQLALAGKARYGWCAEFEICMGAAGVYGGAYPIIGGPAGTRALPEGTAVRWHHGPASAVLVRDGAAENPAGTRLLWATPGSEADWVDGPVELLGPAGGGLPLLSPLELEAMPPKSVVTYKHARHFSYEKGPGGTWTGRDGRAVPIHRLLTERAIAYPATTRRGGQSSAYHLAGAPGISDGRATAGADGGEGVRR